MSKHFVAALQDLQLSKSKLVFIGDLEIGVYYLDGEAYAYLSVCPHRGAKICRGLVGGGNLPSKVYEYEYGMDDQILRCPFHAWEFDLKTGLSLLDDKIRLRKYQVEVEDGQVYLVM
jgi:nitrite reductase (NADH) small subunit